MPLGPTVRRWFGPYERQISSGYRSIYLDLDSLMTQLRHWVPRAERILEVGCGEGAVTQRLRQTYSSASITAIDITPRVGRLYQGPQDGVRFRRCDVGEIAASQPGHYDLVLLFDVLHHVPVELRQDILEGVKRALAPNGLFVFKDWQRNSAPIHWLCYASDRWLTGDRIHYMSRDEMRDRLVRSFGETALVDEARVKPWWNNLATLVRP